MNTYVGLKSVLCVLLLPKIFSINTVMLLLLKTLEPPISLLAVNINYPQMASLLEEVTGEFMIGTILA